MNSVKLIEKSENEHMMWWQFECNDWSHCRVTGASRKSLDSKV